MIATATIVPTKKLRIKFSGKRIEDLPGSQSVELRNLGTKLSFTRNGDSKVDGSFNYSFKTLSDSKTFAATNCTSKSSTPLAIKRRAVDAIESPREKKQKLDRHTTQQCSVILKMLRSHPSGWVFNQPVDPVALKIPDYFTIIKDPMDLGTVKSKLEKNMYQGCEEFAADIRLTFSNAMIYNPPPNSVHKMAKELHNFFEKKWELLKEKDINGRPNVQEAKLSSGSTGENHCRNPSSHIILLRKKSTLSDEKVSKPSSNDNCSEGDRAKTLKTCTQKPTRKKLIKGTETGSKNARYLFDKQTLGKADSKCIKCGGISCLCVSSSVLSHASSAGDNSVINDPCTLNCQERNLSDSQATKSDLDSDGNASNMENETKSSCDQFLICVPNATLEEDSTPIFDVQLSPKKALRAAMLKSRFAETILKAQQKTLLDLGKKVDLAKMQQEKERLEKRQREERARLEEQIRAAELAADAEKQLRRERERKAARIALQKVERTVELDQNVESLKELEKLCGGIVFVNCYHGTGSAMLKRSVDEVQLQTPLERLGLYRKVEDDEDEDDETLCNKNEEGEICCTS